MNNSTSNVLALFNPTSILKSNQIKGKKWVSAALTFLAFFLCSGNPLLAQNPKKNVTSINKNFATKLVIEQPQKINKVSKKEDHAMTVGERELHEFNLLKDPATGKIPKEAARKSLDAAQASTKYENLPAGQRMSGALVIESKGPNNVGGKTRALGIDVRNANIMIAGSTSSGVYRTSNGGTSWTRVVPAGAVHNITCVAQDPRPGFQDTWYFGTGESSGNSASIGSFYLGFGIFKSTDNGITWTQLSSTAAGTLQAYDNSFDLVHKLIVNPVNGDVYAGASNVIRKSTNGGLNWTTVLGTFTDPSYTDIIVTPTGRLYAAIAGTNTTTEGVYTSTTGNAGAWTKIAGTISSVKTPATWANAGAYGRIVLAYAPSNTDVIYALYDNGKVSNCAGVATPEADFFKYTFSTNTWENRSAFLPDEPGCSNGNDPFANQGGYDLVVSVKPDNADIVFVGGTNIYRSTDGFASNSNTTRIGGYAGTGGYAQYVNSHPDQHTIVWATGDNNTLYSGNDGGIQKADIATGTVVWTPLNNDYVTYMYYHTDLSPVAGQDLFVGGAQDNGTTISNVGSNATSPVFGGDGAGVGFIRYTSPTNYNLIGSTQNGSTFRFTSFSAGFAITPAGSTSPFVTYFYLDPDNTNHLYYAGSASIYRTRNAAAITSGTVNATPATNWQLMTGTGLTGNIACFATSRNNAYANAAYTASDVNRKLYIGTTNGRVYRLDDPAFTASTTPAVDITPTTASVGVVSSLSVNPLNDKELMVTYANYGIISVFHTFDASAASVVWTNIEGPTNSPVQISSARSSAIVVVAGVTNYYVGTTVGLYTTAALSGTTTAWTQVGSSEINYSVISRLNYRPADNKILAGTHGNGAFLITLQDQVVLAIKLQSFTAIKSGKDALLNWSVGNSSTAKSFEILSSRDGINFSSLKTVQAQTNKTAYQTKDFQLASGITYYKLKITDVDGSVLYSGIATVTMGIESFSITSLSPNPVSTTTVAFIDAQTASKATMVIVNASGKMIQKQSISLTKGQNSYSLNLGNLATGVYYLYLIVNNEKKNVVKFVKD